MSTITFWLIRHKPSGGYLPEPAGRMGRGGSHVEPTLHVDNLTRPRLFISERAAKIALGSWLKGKVHHSSGYHEDYFSGGREYYEDLDVEHVPSRKREDMEITSVDMVIP